MNFKITVAAKNEQNGQDKTYQFQEGKVKIGRLKDNDIVLDFPAVSGYHGKFRLVGGDQPQAFVTDFGSLNGISVDGQKIEPNQEAPVEFAKPVELCIFSLTVSAETSAQQEEKKPPATPKQRQEEPAAQPPPATPPEKKLTEPQADDQSKATGEKREKENNSDGQQDSPPEKPLETPPTEEKPQPPEKADASGKDSVPASTIKFKAGESSLQDLDFFAEELLTLSGTVRLHGEPLAGVTVKAGNLGERETGKDGDFAFDEIPEGGEYRISLAKPGCQFEPATLEGILEGDRAFEIKAVKLVEIKGRITHKQQPLAGVEVDGGPLGKTTSRDDGAFAFNDIPEGAEYELKFHKPQYKFQPETLNGKAGGPAENQVRAVKLVEVKGRVMHKGKPLEGVEIDAGPLGKTTTDANGVYLFKDVPEDTEFTITARKPKYNLTPRQK